MTPAARRRTTPTRKSRAGRRPSAEPRRPRSRRRTWLRVTLATLLLGLAAWLALFAWGFLPASPGDERGRAIRFESADPGAAVEALEAAGLVDSSLLFRAYLALARPLVRVVPRQHWLRGGRTPRELALALEDRGGQPVRVAFPEGQTRFDLAERLERAHVCSGEAFLAAARDPALLAEFDVPGSSAEGYLFPESHEVRQDDRAERVLQRFLREGLRRRRALEQRYPLLEEHRALGFGWAEVVTLASIVERETANPAERPKIARVFLNRLLAPGGETGGRLESDPTSLYGCLALALEAPPTCRESGGVASPALLKDATNPYGTYRRAGLPPGPIGNPGEAALVAVLRPAPGDELYFVADGRGNHHFSRTFAQHRAAVEELKARRRGRVPAPAPDPDRVSPN